MSNGPKQTISDWVNRIDEDSLNLASKVNGHILKCDDCLKLVKAI